MADWIASTGTTDPLVVKEVTNYETHTQIGFTDATMISLPTDEIRSKGTIRKGHHLQVVKVRGRVAGAWKGGVFYSQSKDYVETTSNALISLVLMSFHKMPLNEVYYFSELAGIFRAEKTAAHKSVHLSAGAMPGKKNVEVMERAARILLSEEGFNVTISK